MEQVSTTIGMRKANSPELDELIERYGCGPVEALLKVALLEKLHDLPAGQLVMLKLTLPEQDDFYADFVKHPKVLRVVALSGGYSREEANNRLRWNHGVIASFSRALAEGLSANQSDAAFNDMLHKSIQSIFDASNT
jgi:fructose-bisphosphate aldolase, class I